MVSQSETLSSVLVSSWSKFKHSSTNPSSTKPSPANSFGMSSHNYMVGLIRSNDSPPNLVFLISEGGYVSVKLSLVNTPASFQSRFSRRRRPMINHTVLIEVPDGIVPVRRLKKNEYNYNSWLAPLEVKLSQVQIQENFESSRAFNRRHGVRTTCLKTDAQVYMIPRAPVSTPIS